MDLTLWAEDSAFLYFCNVNFATLIIIYMYNTLIYTIIIFIHFTHTIIIFIHFTPSHKVIAPEREREMNCTQECQLSFKYWVWTKIDPPAFCQLKEYILLSGVECTLQMANTLQVLLKANIT